MHAASIAQTRDDRSSELSLPLAYAGTFRDAAGHFLKDWHHHIWFVGENGSVQALDRSDAARGWKAPRPEGPSTTQALLLRVREVVDCTVALARQWD